MQTTELANQFMYWADVNALVQEVIPASQFTGANAAVVIGVQTGMLGITAESNALEIGSGSGRYALQVASATGCRIVGVDVNDPGVQNANQLAASQNLAERVLFEKCDASQPLRYGEATFDAVFSNDVLCHIPGRDKLLRGLFRVLKPGGRLLFSDALVIGGVISHQEIAARSSIGYFLFSPPGENERTLHGYATF